MKIKVSKHKLNIHYRGSPWGSRTQQHAYCLRYAHSQHIESHLGKKQPQAKIAIAFLFGQLHFNDVTSHALFLRRPSCYAQEEMRSAKPGNHLKQNVLPNSILGVLVPGQGQFQGISKFIWGKFSAQQGLLKNYFCLQIGEWYVSARVRKNTRR